MKKEHAEGLGTEFFKLTQLAGQAIRQATLPDHFKVTVLFDAFYLCPEVINACKERKWRYISVGAPKGIFIMTIQVVASETRPELIKLKFTYDGNWDNYKVEEYK